MRCKFWALALFALSTQACLDPVSTLNETPNDVTDATEDQPGAAAFAILTSPPTPTLGELLLVDAEGELVDGLADIGDVPNRLRLLGGKLYVPSSLSNKVGIYGLAPLTLETELTLPAGSNPMDVALAAERIFVSNLYGDSISVFDAATGAAIGDALASGTQPTGLFANGQEIVVANSGFEGCNEDFTICTYADGSLSVFDAGNLSSVTTVTLPCKNTTQVEGDGDSLYVLCSGDYSANLAMVYQLSATDYSVTASLPVGFSAGTLSLSGDRLFVGGFATGLQIVDLADFSLSLNSDASVLSLEDVNQVAVDAAGRLWVAQWSQKRVSVLNDDYALQLSVDIGAEVQDIVALP